ncbi:unnamed protein product [Chrysoparadoxa australica]
MRGWVRLTWCLCSFLFLPCRSLQPSLAPPLPLSVNSLPLQASPQSIYIHIPFCRRRCYYCDFPIKVVGDSPDMARRMAEPYIDMLLRELQASIKALEATGMEMAQLETTTLSWWCEQVYVGGGTPSLCPPDLLGKVFKFLREQLGLSSAAEVCAEMDPGTFDEALLAQFLGLGLTRVSMGVQSFDAELLKSCGRAHTLNDVYNAVDLLHKAGMDNFSIDLIGGLPGQGLEQWDHSLGEAVQTGAAHVSVYDLQVEPGTAFDRWYQPGQYPLPSHSLSADMYQAASETLQAAGYDHYEVSNYGKPGYHSRHNTIYWRSEPFLGVGNGAASYIMQSRFSRPRGLLEYQKWIERLETVGWNESTEASPETPREHLLEGLMLGLRTSAGVTLQGLDAATRSSIQKGMEDGLSRGLVVQEGERLRLTDPEGFMLSNDGECVCARERERSAYFAFSHILQSFRLSLRR